MFSPALGRVVRTTSALPTAAQACTVGRVATCAPQTLSRPTHARRLSSSKASIPPDGSNGSSSTQQTKKPAPKVSTKDKVTPRAGGKKPADNVASVPASALNVPHVPPTDHVQTPEVKVSSFFSLHRPITISAAIPPASTIAEFDSIFQPRASTSKKAMTYNMQTISGGLESLEAALRLHEQKSPEETVEDVHHLDGPPQVSLDELMAKFVPFRPPPAPVPFDQAPEFETLPSQQDDIVPVKKRTWRTAVVVTESTDAAGKRTYFATTEPMVETPVNTSQEVEQVGIRQPFVERLRQRQNTHSSRDMFAISVKRQRKLKMKKHKYKKLMKRTRLLRRKLDRA